MTKFKSHKRIQKKKLKKYNNTKKIKRLPNHTPYYINEISQQIFDDSLDNNMPLEHSVIASYSPTINKELVLLQSMEREKIHNCNNPKAFELKESLEIGLPGKIYGKTCVPYYNHKAISFLLKNLSANKHVNPTKIIPPIQSLSNCWFNTMFVTFFVSDKGRKFFHFFRQLMIEGKQSNGKEIPNNLRNSFALLNYAIDACLTGSSYAYELNTNTIIKTIYDAIPNSYKSQDQSIININDAGNPIYYYISLIQYLDNKSLQLLLIKSANENWKNIILNQINNQTHLPHIIVLEIYDGENKSSGISGQTTNKPKSFFIKGAKYVLDSGVIRDTTQQHFCSVITCENKEMAYDGMSFHRLVALDWKQNINSDFIWEFEGSNNLNGNPLQWNFLHGYQLLLYYRVK
jgi:hypothetical protein